MQVDAQPHESEATPASEALVLRPLEQGDVFEYTTPVNGWRVQARIVLSPIQFLGPLSVPLALSSSKRTSSSTWATRTNKPEVDITKAKAPKERKLKELSHFAAILETDNVLMGGPSPGPRNHQHRRRCVGPIRPAQRHRQPGKLEGRSRPLPCSDRQQSQWKRRGTVLPRHQTREQAQSLLGLVGTYYSTNEREDFKGLLQALVDDAGLHSYIDLDSLEKDQVMQVMQKIVDGVNMQDLEVVRDSPRPEIVTERQDSPAAPAHLPTVD
ncbi:hypothetical protein LTR47_006946 [Exophiala xenobiotica]|nr:hypothetical protein LTR47_006946 [Exophiala xenobiotica]KAK5259422.1 hypothetical protein LTR40_006021 [Exophiala xenobiotica]KAK5326445.1 hypothetical protein LTR93_003307 [Exophiala xenobiotica]KAK5353134.1 hypothetical protein LTR61_003091 [Exophiala xenobiotica]KAK5379915.1 hypothetical protein LTR11_003543 [Exophiala xenobiotica]